METPNPTAPLRTVVIVVMPDVQLLHAAGPCDVFTYATKLLESLPGPTGYRVVLASATEELQIVTNSGIPIACSTSVLDIGGPIDTLLLAGNAFVTAMEALPQPFYDWLSWVFPHVRRVAAVCTGAFVLAKAGLLDHRTATTHYEFCPTLRQNYPLINVAVNPFFVRDGKLYTSGGVSSGLNLSLALIEEDFGREVALRVARKLILELRRAGSQAQFSTLLPTLELRSSLVKTLRPWLTVRLPHPIKVEDMAEQVNMSPRNFARLFSQETGITPAKFLEKLRVEAARQYLEDTNLSLEQIADECGLGGMVSMRRVFLRHLNLSPAQYRHSFQTSLATELELAD